MTIETNSLSRNHMNSRETINILCATDDNYVPYCGIMLTSVFENNKEYHVDAYVLVDTQLSDSSIMKFSELEAKYDATIHYVHVMPTRFSAFPLHEEQHFTVAAYYRLAAAELLPKDIDRILYLDCDIVVNSSLRELWNLDIANYSTAVVDDMCSGLKSNFERLKYDQSLRYFNSGVLLINLDYWRKHQLMKQFEAYAIEHRDRILWPDQDVLNAVLLESKLHIGIEWNYQMGFLKQSYFETLSTSLQNEIRTTQPKILHYNQSKPWSVTYYNLPYNDVWHLYKNISPWKGIGDIYPSHKKINYFIKRWILWPLGILNSTDTIQR